MANAELRSELRKLPGQHFGRRLCGRPTKKRGSPPCERFRSCWPCNGTIELWACIHHLGENETRLLKQVWTEIRASTAADRQSRPLPAGWQSRVRYLKVGADGWETDTECTCPAVLRDHDRCT